MSQDIDRGIGGQDLPRLVGKLGVRAADEPRVVCEDVGRVQDAIP